MMNVPCEYGFLTKMLLSFFLMQSSMSYAEEGLVIKSEVLKGGTKVGIVVGVSEFSDDDLMFSDPIWWGAELTSPRTYIKKVLVRVGENESLVRLSSYSDLVNINSIDLAVIDQGFSILVDGGETATHYKAVINFDNEGYLLNRKVYSPSFPEEIWEETRYSFVRRQDM